MTFHRNISVQEAREKIAANSAAMQAADGQFFADLERRFEALKSKSSHPADFRRLSAEVREGASRQTSKQDWSAQKDGPAYEGALAWMDMIDREIENRAITQELGFGGAPQADGWFDRATGKPVAVYAPGDKIGGGAAPNLSVGNLMEGILYGPRDASVKNALEEGTSSAGGYTVPTILLPQFIDKLRAKARFIQAGARTVMLDTLTTNIARVETDPTAAWRAESAAVAESAPTFGVVSLTAKSLAVLVKCSVELLQDSVNVGEALETALINAMSLELDRAAFFGSGSSNQPTGLFNVSGINSVSMGTNGSVPTNHDYLLDAFYELELDNADPATAAIMHPRTAKTFRKLKDTDGNPVRVPEPVASLPMLNTTSVPITQTQGTSSDCSTILMGDFSQAMLGIRQQLTIQRLDQTYAGNLQVGFLASLRADVAFAHPESFCKIIGIKP